MSIDEEQRQRLFLAIADPTRRKMIETLAVEGEKTPTELAQKLPITRQGVSKHMHILADAGLVDVRQAGRDRYYKLRPEMLAETTSWVDRVKAQWSTRLSALVDFLNEDD